MPMEPYKHPERSPATKAWIQGSIYALIIVLLLLVRATFGVWLLILAGALIAIFFSGLSGLICRKTHWKQGICLTVSILGTMLLVMGLFWLIGARLQSQISQLSDQLPAMAENAKAKISEHPLGKKMMDQVSATGSVKKAKALAGTFFKSTFGVFGDLYAVLFLGIFFTVSPGIYKKGIVALIPPKGKERGEAVLQQLATQLKKWLKGKIFAMFVVAVLTAVGLAALGVPMWLVLALIAGILNFVPNFGPLIAMVPAVLVALMQDMTTAILVASLYVVIQVVESNFITPKVQQRLVSIPPALIISAQLLIGPLTGGWGLVLATPLALIVMTLVQELYVKRQQA